MFSHASQRRSVELALYLDIFSFFCYNLDMKIVVIGNIGCGKSTVCRLLAHRLSGYEQFSVDDAVRGLYANPGYLAAVTRAFGVSDRKALSDLVFADPSKKSQLEKLSAGFVRPLIEAAVSLPRVIIEFPLLFEIPGWAPRADFVLALGCDEETQRQRVLGRDGITVEKFERIRASQYSTELKAALADAYLDTSGSLVSVEASVEGLLPLLEVQELKARCERFFGSGAIWPLIRKAYSEEHRAYHNLSHLREVFAALEPHLSSAAYPRAIEMAVWFHDFVYSTEPGAYAKNEALSARALYEKLSDALPDWLTGQHAAEVFLAVEFILATKRHRGESPYVRATEARQSSCALFLDADLCILAANPGRLTAYDNAIAAEWGQRPEAPSAAFCEGRALAMESFAARPRIFFSPEFAAKEPLARDNLTPLAAHWRKRALVDTA